MQCKITLFAVPSKKWGPRTIDFYNNLYFNKIQIGLVRGLLSKGTNPIPVTIDEAARRSEGSVHLTRSRFRLSLQILLSLLILSQCFPGDPKIHRNNT